MTVPLRLKKGREEAVRDGSPWIYATDLVDSSEWRLSAPGSLGRIETQRGEFVGVGYVNPVSQIACRVLSRKDEKIDAEFFIRRIRQALAAREKIIPVPYYRLAHAEADGLCGLTIDRFGDILVIQVGTAGMEALQPQWMEALETVLSPKAVLLKNDIPARKLEGLAQTVSVAKGEIPDTIEVRENGLIYFADLLKGQKTGWFYDQRDNHKIMAELSSGKTVLDVYSHSGGFGLLAAKHGAQAVTMVDSSGLALELAKKAQAKNDLAHCDYIRGDAFETMQSLAGKTYDIVIADPPPFVKSKKDIASGLKGYEKMARLAATLVAPGGWLFAASCSHHASRSAFAKAVMEGVAKAGREGKIVKHTGAAPDHPVHPKLPQSEYLKGLLLRIA